MARLVHQVELRGFSEGELVLHQGEPAQAMYFIISGRVEIILRVRAIHKHDPDELLPCFPELQQAIAALAGRGRGPRKQAPEAALNHSFCAY
jgi:hypothetical protein